MNFWPLIIAECLALRWMCRHLKGLLIGSVIFVLLVMVLTFILQATQALGVWPYA